MDVEFPVRLKSKYSESYVSVGGKKIHYLTIGEGKELILLHGANIGIGQWYKNIAHFSKYFKVYAIDLLGASMSSKIDLHTSDLKKYWIDSTIECLLELNLKYDIRIVAHASSAWIAINIGESKKIEFSKMVLVSPLGIQDHVPLKSVPISIPYVASFLSNIIMKPTNRNIEIFLKSCVVNKDIIDNSLVDYVTNSIIHEKITHPIQLFSRMSHLFTMKEEFIVKEKLANLSSQILILLGEKDTFMNNKEIISFAEKNNQLQLIKYNNCGHLPFIENSKKFNEDVTSFLL